MHVLSTVEIRNIEKKAIDSGFTSELELMQRAGQMAAEKIAKHYGATPTLVICGPGNNGGDGFVVAQSLFQKGWDVSVASFKNIDDLAITARALARRYEGKIVPLSLDQIKNKDPKIIIDALFGIGLSKPISKELRDIIDYVNKSGCKIISIDISSGIESDSGEILENAFNSELTITFIAKKPGHLLLPGRVHSGKVLLCDIGIKYDDSLCYENVPELWLSKLPRRDFYSHKYNYGHSVIIGGEKIVGAAKLASKAALRIGSGLVTLLSEPSVFSIYAGSLDSVIVSSDTIDRHLSDPRKNTYLVGPGNGVNEKTKTNILSILKAQKNCIIDADGITSFSEDRDTLFKAIKNSNSNIVLTPHYGEFKKLFPSLGGKNKLEAAREAAKMSGAVIVYKGADTVIASPDGKGVINTNAPPTLATAGSGDILSGIITGLIAQGMNSFEAASAGVWIHGASADLHGEGLISEDIIDKIPSILQSLHKSL